MVIYSASSSSVRANEMKGTSSKCVHAGERRDANGAVIGPIYQTSTYDYPNQDRRTWEGELPAGTYIYARHGNPSVEEAERKASALEGGERAVLFSSGMAASTATLLTFLSAGDNVVSMEDIYGGTYAFLTKEARRLGIEVRFCPSTRPEDIARLADERTRVVWLETPTNPTLRIADIAATASLVKAPGRRLVVDATFASPINLRPLAQGADIVVHSCTKYLNGHSDLVAGVAIGSGGDMEQVWQRRVTLGGALDPLGAFLLARGMKTLDLRMRQHNENGMMVADHLSRHPKVRLVNYPGLRSHPQHGLAARTMKGFGGMLSFAPLGGRAEAERVISSLKVFRMAASLGGVESLASMPVNTSHTSFTAADRQRLGISDDLIRLSIGIEDAADLVDDLDQALG
jgi:cystathionine beta-lyase/cystathionine gamma-synthase